MIKICPRCGEERMNDVDVRNALSRHKDIYICSQCGNEEAFMDFVGMELPFEEWAINKKATYVVQYGNGTAWLSEEVVELDEPTTDYQAILDIAIDQMEARGETHQFIENTDDVNEDEYVTGGNHCLNLMHYGNLNIERR